ncbi:MAG: leucyl aminopeptidase [Acidimicrobiia bacterium]
MIEFLTAGSIDEGTEDALLVAVGADSNYDAGAAWVIDRLPWVGARLEAKEFSGKKGSVAVISAGDALTYNEIVFVGVGETPTAEVVREAAGIAARALKSSATIATTLHAACEDGAGAVAMGLVLGAYSFDRHKSEPKPSNIATVAFVDGTDAELEAAAEVNIITDAVILARDLVNESAMYKSPVTMAEIATEMAAEVGLEIRVMDETEIEAERLGGLHGVSMGATNPPRLVELRHEPEGAKAFLAIVGKGIVFDSGGLSLKPANSMEEMKTDMSGAAAVFGAMKAIALLDIPVKVVGITPLTENMPGGAAVRPGDVLHTRNGKTIEVLNTDAEGRLVLADGLALAAEQSPDLVIDLATLTGACMVALGTKIGGLFGTDDAVAMVSEAAEAAGERMWHLPLPEDYRKQIDSDVADMKNTGERYGGAITAALLLQEFAGDGPWAHLDIAGPARAPETDGYAVKGGTGFGVRTIVELARRMGE